MQGRIIKGIAGFYYVYDVVESVIYECKAKGIFRKEKIKPLVGDLVEYEILDAEEKTGNIIRILPRKNELIRPAVANIDQALVVFAVKKPDPHFNLLDRFLVMMERQEIPVIICFNKKDIADELGIGSEVIVAAGAGDNAAAAVGTGTVGDGHCNVSLGTSGTIFISSKEFGVDSNNALHSFAHADGKYHLMGCILSAASANGWWMDKILGTNDYAGEQSQITDDDLGNNNVYFLPYLMGERSPHNDEFARGTFTGMTMDTERRDMTQAVLEGVAFAIRDCFEVAKSLGIRVESTRMCGGGAKSELWCKIMANVLGIPVELLESEEGPAMGAAMLAMVAAGEYNCVEDASNALVKVRKTIRPDEKIIERYEDKYNKFRCIYPAMKNVFRTINE